MNLIVAADLKWGIGFQDKLLVSLSEDMKRFKEMTLGQVVLWGRRTLQTFPGGRPLPGRTNIILTHQAGFTAGDALICHTFAELGDQLSAFAQDSVFVIGGSSVYRQLLPYCRQAYVTRIDQFFEADAFFPDLDHQAGWRLDRCGPKQTGFSRIGNTTDPLTYHFCLYRQDNPSSLDSMRIEDCARSGYDG